MQHTIIERLNGKKILFATVPADGHFNPLTGLAKYLQDMGCDVRWYISDVFEERLKKLGIPQYTYEKALNLSLLNMDELFPERKFITDVIQRMNDDSINLLAARSVEYFEDIQQIHKSFPFELVVSDSMYSAVPFIRVKMKIPVLCIGIAPLAENSINLAPYGMSLPPAQNEDELKQYAELNQQIINVTLKPAIDFYDNLLRDNGIEMEKAFILHLIARQSSLYLQIGIPDFEYPRPDLGNNIRYIGALLPYSSGVTREKWLDERVNQYKKIVLVTQGTLEIDTRKIIEPTLQAFKDTDVLVIVTTGGNGTAALRENFKAENFMIEDYIPFADVMPYANVYITNGGYSGTLLSISNRLPIVAAGIHEGKGEICARIAYTNIGINLNTEYPTPEMIRASVEKVMADETYKNNISKLYAEMTAFNALESCAEYAAQLLNGK